MLYVLSPAKSLDEVSPLPSGPPRRHAPFVPRAAELIGQLRTRSAAQIAELMDLSPALAQLNAERYAAWSTRFTARNSRPAVFAFDGDVYAGLDAWSLAEDDLRWAQRHVAILSGLYGVLRPLDRLQPYRLEMGTSLAGAHGRTLYDYWGDALAEHLNARMATDETPVLVNLASQEYFRAAQRRVLKARVIDCVFEDWSDGRYKIVGFFAKRARGMMARHAILGRIRHPDALRGFDAAGYRFDEAASEASRLVFRRRVQG